MDLQPVDGGYKDKTLTTIPFYGGGSSFETNRRLCWRDTQVDASKKWKKALAPTGIRKIPKYLRKRLSQHPHQPNTNVLNSRWITSTKDEEFRGLFRDKELLSRSQLLFEKFHRKRSALPAFLKSV